MGKTMTFDQKLKCVDLFSKHLVKRSDGFVVWAEGWSDARAAEVVKCKANQVAHWRTQRGFKLSPAPKTNALRKLPDLEKQIEIYTNSICKRMDSIEVDNANVRARIDHLYERVRQLEERKTSYVSLAPKPPAAE